jgi:hypothetical protein
VRILAPTGPVLPIRAGEEPIGNLFDLTLVNATSSSIRGISYAYPALAFGCADLVDHRVAALPCHLTWVTERHRGPQILSVPMIQ